MLLSPFTAVAQEIGAPRAKGVTWWLGIIKFMAICACSAIHAKMACVLKQVPANLYTVFYLCIQQGRHFKNPSFLTDFPAMFKSLCGSLLRDKATPDVIKNHTILVTLIL